jgi:hypothetical protein
MVRNQASIWSCVFVLGFVGLSSTQCVLAGIQVKCGCPKVEAIEFSSNDKRDVTFTVVFQGDALSSEDKTILSVTTWKGSDGVKLSAISGNYDSPVHAKSQLDADVAKAQRILRRSKKRDKMGKVVGDRVEALVAAGGQGDVISAIMWTSGTSYYQILSRKCMTSSAYAPRNLVR